MKTECKFSLVELIAIVVILAIISVIALAKIFNIKDEAKRHSEEAILAECVNTLSGAYYQHVVQNNGEIPDIATLRTKTEFGSSAVPASYNDEFEISLEEGSLTSQYIITIEDAPWDLSGVTPTLLMRTIVLDSAQ